MRVQDLQIEDKTYKDLFQQQYLADGYNAAQHTLRTPRLASKKMTADKFNKPAADMGNLQDDWFVGVVKYVADLAVKFGTNVEYIMQDVGEYSDNTQYHLGQVVTYQGSKWICIVDTQITVPPSISGDTWLQMPNGEDGLSGVDFGVSDLYADNQAWDSAKLYSKNDLVYYAITDIAHKPDRTMLFAALRANSGINPTSAGQDAWLKIFDQPATKIVISENEPVDKYTGQIWGEKSKMANYYSDGSPYYNLTMHQYNGSSWDNLYPKTKLANVVDGVTDKLIVDPANVGQPIKENTILGYENDTWTDVNRYKQAEADARYLKLSGGALTGPLQIAKGTATNSAIRLDEIKNGVALTDGSNWVAAPFLDDNYRKPWAYSASSDDKTIIMDENGNIASIDRYGEIGNLRSIDVGTSTLAGLAYGAGKFVALCKSQGIFYYSSNGLDFSEGNLPAALGWSDICYGGGKFVAIRTNTQYGAYSNDGITWTRMTLPVSAAWSAVTYGNGRFVAIGGTNSRAAAWSVDGITWTQSELPTTTAWIDVAYGNGKFIAIADNMGGEKCAVSSDGDDWTASNFIGFDANQLVSSSITFGAGKFVVSTRATGSGIVTLLWSSKDENNWEPEELRANVTSRTHVSYGQKMFLMFIENADAPDYYVASAGNVRTLDGTASSSDISSALVNSLDISAQKTNLKAIATAIKNKKGSTATIQASKFATEIRNLPEPPKWVSGNLPAISYPWQAVCYGDGKFVVIAYNTNIGAYSTDGITWGQSTLPRSILWKSICYGNGKFVAISTGSNYTMYSIDGIHWENAALSRSEAWESVCYGNGKFVIVASGTSIVAYSSDGILWSFANMPSTLSWYSVTYGGGKFVAVANSSEVAAYSTDGMNWAVTTLPRNTTWYAATYGNGKFVAVSYADNALAYSEDGITWTLSTVSTSTTWNSIAYGGNKFVVVAENGTVAYSTDGITWTQVTIPSGTGWRSVTYGAGKFMAIDHASNSCAYIQDSHTTLG